MNLQKRFVTRLNMKFVNQLIPNEHNEYIPGMLRFHRLGALTAFIALLKIIVLFTLFIIYPSQAYFSTVTSANIIELTNQQREAAGLEKLIVNEKLNRVAQRKLDDMFARQFFSHTDPDGEKVWRLLSSEGYEHTYAGENLAMNFYSAEEAVSAWMGSKKHRQNILSKQYRDIGVAVGVGSLHGQTVSLVVQIFGTEFTNTTSDFRRSVSSMLGVETPGIEILGESRSVALKTGGGSWFRFLSARYKNIFLFFGLFLSVSLLGFAFYESKHHHRRLAMGLVALGVVFAAITLNGHFLEGISGILMVG